MLLEGILLRSIRSRFPAYTFFKEENRGNGRFLDGSYPLLVIYIYLFIYLYIFVLIFFFFPSDATVTPEIGYIPTDPKYKLVFVQSHFFNQKQEAKFVSDFYKINICNNFDHQTTAKLPPIYSTKKSLDFLWSEC